MSFQPPTEDDFFSTLPDELKNLLVNYFSNREALTKLRPVSKDFLAHVLKKVIFTSGAKNYEDFIERIQALSPMLQSLILDSKYNLTFAEEVRDTSRLPEDQRDLKLFEPGQNLTPFVNGLMFNHRFYINEDMIDD